MTRMSFSGSVHSEHSSGPCTLLVWCLAGPGTAPGGVSAIGWLPPASAGCRTYMQCAGLPTHMALKKDKLCAPPDPLM